MEFPPADPAPWLDPDGFPEALTLQMARHGETAYALTRALRAQGHMIDHPTLRQWRSGGKTPESRQSFERLAAIERRYRLPPGYFRDKVQSSRAVRGQASHLSEAERRRLAWHLPHDFDRRSPIMQDRILTWVREVIVGGATDYRRYQRQALLEPYALDFDLDRTGEGPVLAARPNLGARRCARAPVGLREEVCALLRFKTALLGEPGRRRRGVWGDETASQRVSQLSLMFGALAADPAGPNTGFGVAPDRLTLALLVLPQVWDRFLEWRQARRGFFTRSETDLLVSLAGSLTAPETGWLTQSPGLSGRLQAIDGLVSPEDIETARSDWPGACARMHAHALARAGEVRRVARVHRDPFEAVLVVLEAESPLAEYRKIADEIAARMPDRRRHPLAAAEANRAFLMIRLGLHLGFRQRNLRQLLLRPKGEPPTPERQLEAQRRGELRWNARDGVWEVFAPAAAFKNGRSSYFAGRPFRAALPDFGGLYAHLQTWIATDRSRLLRGHPDPGTLFVKTMHPNSRGAEYDKTGFYEAWRAAISRYGVHNPWTGRGAVPGLLPHGPHSVRDVLATHILKVTGSYEQASYAIQDTPDMVAAHYGRFLPHDKAAIAARVLNQVWQNDPPPARPERPCRGPGA